MKIAIFHDYFGAIGGGERVVVAMAKILDADIITTDTDAVRKLDPSVRVISLGKTIHYPPLKQISASFLFRTCDFSERYDFFIFTGNWSPAAHTAIIRISGIVTHLFGHFTISILCSSEDRMPSPASCSDAGPFSTADSTCGVSEMLIALSRFQQTFHLVSSDTITVPLRLFIPRSKPQNITIRNTGISGSQSTASIRRSVSNSRSKSSAGCPRRTLSLLGGMPKEIMHHAMLKI